MKTIPIIQFIVTSFSLFSQNNIDSDSIKNNKNSFCYLNVPRNHSVNDLFIIETDCLIDSFSFKLYNLWGNILFESTTFNKNGYNIIFKNDTINEGVYIWFITYKTIYKNEKTIKGELTINHNIE